MDLQTHQSVLPYSLIFLKPTAQDPSSDNAKCKIRNPKLEIKHFTMVPGHWYDTGNLIEKQEQPGPNAKFQNESMNNAWLNIHLRIKLIIEMYELL